MRRSTVKFPTFNFQKLVVRSSPPNFTVKSSPESIDLTDPEHYYQLESELISRVSNSPLAHILAEHSVPISPQSNQFDHSDHSDHSDQNPLIEN